MTAYRRYSGSCRLYYQKFNDILNSTAACGSFKTSEFCRPFTFTRNISLFWRIVLNPSSALLTVQHDSLNCQCISIRQVMSHSSKQPFHGHCSKNVKSQAAHKRAFFIARLTLYWRGGFCPKQWRTGGGGLGFQPPIPEIPKALQNRAKLNPIVKT